MQTKLTLRMDDELISHAKQIAKEQGKSLSQIVADYFSVLTTSHKPDLNKDLKITKALDELFETKPLSIADEKSLLEDALADKYGF